MKLIKINSRGIKVFGYKHLFMLYGKNRYRKYRIEISFQQFGGFSIPIYESKKNKPIFKDLVTLSILCTPLWLTINIIMISLIPILMYLEGGLSFTINSHDITHVRFFNWMNIGIIIILIILLSLKN